jgi:hypothetical protein
LLAPWLLVPNDGVEDGEELAGGGDEGDELELSGLDELVAEELEVGVVPRARLVSPGRGGGARP